MECSRSYLVRYGLTARVGRFTADDDAAYTRGQTVVIRSHRGTELGETLIEAPLGVAADADALAVDGLARILRAAGPDDLARARRAELERPERFAACERVFQVGVWPLLMVDVEVLLDDDRVVVQFLGPHKLDLAGLHAVFRNDHGLNVMLEAVGRDAPDEEVEAGDGDDDDHSRGRCGSEGGGCGAGGGGCGTSTSAGCDACGVKKLMSARR